MKLLILSDLESTGGAGIACRRLTEGMLRLGVHCVRAVGAFDGGAADQPKLLLTQGRRLEGVTALASAFGFKTTAGWLASSGMRRQLRAAILRERPDAIHIHNLHKAGWDIGMVEECALHAPVVWTLHDMWGMTGHCYAAYDCTKFITGCDASCPIPDEYPAMPPRLIGPAWARRKAVLEAHPGITAACPSAWMAGQARKGIWKNNRVEVIANGLDLDIYRPGDAAAARTALGLEPDVLTILLVADYLGDQRSGAGIVHGALSAVPTRPLQILTLGHMPPKFDDPRIRHIHCGYVTSERIKSIIYTAADLLLHMTPVDNLPNTVAEAAACGTPSVAFATGGVPEMVIPGQTGWLTRAFTPEGFAATLDEALAAIACGASPRAECRRFAEEHFDQKLQAAKYIELFESLLKKKP
jgi:glycosyltransferase involved in cell wall biosynthesis